MKYSISVRQPDSNLQEADEIRVNYIDINILYDKIEVLPNKIYNIVIPKGTEVNWEELSVFANKATIIVGLEDLNNAQQCRKNHLRFYWVYPITSYYELRGLLATGITEVVLGAPLYFDVKGVKQVADNINIRLVANVCHDGFFPREDGVCGTYVRPEDVVVYEPYVDTLTFEAKDLKQEMLLLSTYKHRQWDGNLNFLLKNLNCNVDNRGIPKEFGAARLQCRQNCMRNGDCHFCLTSIKFCKTLDNNRK